METCCSFPAQFFLFHEGLHRAVIFKSEFGADLFSRVRTSPETVHIIMREHDHLDWGIFQFHGVTSNGNLNLE